MSLTPENIALLKEKRQYLQNELIITSSVTEQFSLKHQIAKIDAELAGTDVANLPTLGEIVQTEKLSLALEIIKDKVDLGSYKSIYNSIVRDNLSDKFGLNEVNIRDRLSSLLRQFGDAKHMRIDINEFNSVTSNLPQNPVTQNTPEMSSLRSYEGISIKTVQTDLFKWKKDFKRRNLKLSENCTELLEKVNNYRLTLEQDPNFDTSLRRFKIYVKEYRRLKLRAEKKQDEKLENFEEQIRKYLKEDIPSLKNLEKAYQRLKLKGYQNTAAEQLIEDEIEDEDIILDVVENMEKFLETF